MSIKKIWLVRHAESAEDVDPAMHSCPNDLQISLTDRGRQQSKELGERFSQKVGERDSIRILLSSSKRARDTWHEMRHRVPGLHEVSVDSRIRNLNWGNTTSDNRHLVEMERYRVGVLNFQFPGGDNTPEYVQGIRQLVGEVLLETSGGGQSRHLMFVSHGFALRVIARSLIGLSDEEFCWLANPPNAFVAELEWDEAKAKATLLTPFPKTKKMTFY